MMAPNYSATAPARWQTTTIVVTNGVGTTTGTVPSYANDWVHIIPIAATTIWDWPQLKVSGPAWERWFDVWREPVKYFAPRQFATTPGLRRAPARKCIRDAHRWKRRRFVQKLHRAAASIGRASPVGGGGNG
jgi:hypothetical protein